MRSTEGSRRKKGIDLNEELTKRHRDMCHFIVQLGVRVMEKPLSYEYVISGLL